MSSTPAVPAGKTISAKDFATQLGIEAKALRSIMRKMTDSDSQPGSGGRWAIVEGSELATELALRVKNSHHRKVTKFG